MVAATLIDVGARLAQSVEHQTFNLRVKGSSPLSGDVSLFFFHLFTADHSDFVHDNGGQMAPLCMPRLGTEESSPKSTKQMFASVFQMSTKKKERIVRLVLDVLFLSPEPLLLVSFPIKTQFSLFSLSYGSGWWLDLNTKIMGSVLQGKFTYLEDWHF